MKLKPALTYDQQIARLINDHHLKISNIEFAEEILKKVNYYRLCNPPFSALCFAF